VVSTDYPLRPIPYLPRAKPRGPLSFHVLAHSFALFCTHQKLNSFVFTRFRTLCQKPPGGGGASATRSAFRGRRDSLLSSDCSLRGNPPSASFSVDGACIDMVGVFSVHSASIPFPSLAFQPSIEDSYPVRTVNLRPFHLLSLLECADPKNAPITPLECAVPKTRHLKSFRMRRSEKRGGREVNC
jgi:hypothetical protein